MLAAIVGQSWATAAHPFNLEVNGTDVIASVQFPTIRIEMPGPGSNGSMSFEIEDRDSSITINKWDEVRFIEHAATRPVLFGGFVQSVRRVAWAAGGRTIVVVCVGYGILLDRKAVPGWTQSADDPGTSVPDRVASIVNRHGGRVSGLTTTLGVDEPTTAAKSIARFYNWDLTVSEVAIGYPSASLRGMVEAIVGAGEYVTTNGNYPVGAAYWVDGYARFRFHPDPHPVDPTAVFAAQAFDGGMPGIELDLSGANIVVDPEYEDEDADRLTSAYVESDAVTRVASEANSATSIINWVAMAEGAYVLDGVRPSWGGGGRGFVAVVQHASTSTTDDLGSVVITGIDLFGRQQTETISPIADKKAFGSQVWDIITSVESREWTAAAGADLIAVGNRYGRWAPSAGTGYWRSEPLERAGDLETLIADDQSTTTPYRDNLARAAVGATAGITARGSVEIESNTPLDIWPGRHLTVTAPQLDQDGTVDWRITGTTIRFRTTTYRTYEISYGGTVPKPSMVRSLARGRVGPAADFHRRARPVDR